MKITDALVAEHGTFYVLMEQIGKALVKSNNLQELHFMASFLEKLLSAHSDAEEELILPALDHALAESGHSGSLHQAHLEIDVRLKEAQDASQLLKARRLIEGAISISRKHFKYEEQTVFPLAEKVMTLEMLEKLGDEFMSRRRCHSEDAA